MMQKQSAVAVGLDQIAERLKKNPNLGRVLEVIDAVDHSSANQPADDTYDQALRLPYSSDPPPVGDIWQ